MKYNVTIALDNGTVYEYFTEYQYDLPTAIKLNSRDEFISVDDGKFIIKSTHITMVRVEEVEVVNG